MRFRLAGGEFAPVDAADIAALEQGDVERGRGISPDAKPITRSRPFQASERSAEFGQRAADRIVNDVDARGRKLLEPRAHVLACGVDRLGRAMAPREGELFVRGRAGDHPRAHRLADLHRREPNAAGRAEHEKGLAGFHLGALLQRMQRGAVGDRKARRLVERETIGDFRQAIGRDRDPLRRRSISADAHDPVADLKPLGFRSQRDHPARELAAGRKGRLGLHLVLALDDQRVEEVEPGIGDFDHSLARPGGGRLDFHDPQIFRRPKRRTDQGFHALAPNFTHFSVTKCRIAAPA